MVAQNELGTGDVALGRGTGRTRGSEVREEEEANESEKAATRDEFIGRCLV
jgi:hypothetical protein